MGHPQPLFCCDGTWKWKACGSATAHTSDTSLAQRQHEAGAGSELQAQSMKLSGFVYICLHLGASCHPPAHPLGCRSGEWQVLWALLRQQKARGIIIFNALGGPLSSFALTPYHCPLRFKSWPVSSAWLQEGENKQVFFSPPAVLKPNKLCTFCRQNLILSSF